MRLNFISATFYRVLLIFVFILFFDSCVSLKVKAFEPLQTQQLVVRQDSNLVNLTEVKLKYEVEGKSALYISSYGYADLQGTIQFLTPDSLIVFRNGIDGKVIKRFELPEPSITMDPAPVFDLPNYIDFPTIYREEAYRKELSFDDKLRDLLNKYFPSGTSSSEIEGKTVRISPFIRLQIPDAGYTNGEVAVKIVLPFTSGPRTILRLHYLCRENRTSDRRWRDCSDKVQSAAQQFVDQLLKEIHTL